MNGSHVRLQGAMCAMFALACAGPTTPTVQVAPAWSGPTDPYLRIQVGGDGLHAALERVDLVDVAQGHAPHPVARGDWLVLGLSQGKPVSSAFVSLPDVAMQETFDDVDTTGGPVALG